MNASGHVQENHPLAPRMCVIAFLSYNLSLACMYGSFGVLLGAVETKLGIARNLSSLGIPLVIVGLAMASPVAGSLVEKVSIRLLMILGALMSAVAYVVLAISTSVWINLIAYGLLIGPGLCLLSAILPSTLITRWYTVNRGRALGLSSMPLALVPMPLIVAAVLEKYGLSATYYMLAGVMAVSIVPLLFVVDRPPSSSAQSDTFVDAGLTTPQLLRNTSFWILSFAFAAITTAGIVMGGHLVPIVADWGVNLTQAATLMSVSALVGMAGTVIFGWLGDRLGGAKTLALVGVNFAILWALMLTQPSYAMLLPVTGLMGLHASAVVAAFGLALSQRFGQATFGRAFGLTYLLSLPFNVLGPYLAAQVYVGTGSYIGAIWGLIVFLFAAAALALTIRAVKPAPAAAAA